MTGLSIERDGAVTTLRLDRPERRNALTPRLVDALRDAVLAAPGEGARALIVTGAGASFCAGADLGGDSGFTTIDLGALLRTHYHPLIEAIADSPIPIVTAMNGGAAGAGASIALAGDIVVAARSAYLLLAFANIGLVPDAGSTWFIGKAAGRATLMEMALLGEKLGAEDAKQAGLISRVVDDADVPGEALALARTLAAKPTMALGLIRRQARIALAGTLAETLEIEAEHQARAGRSADFAEGVRAFREKRPPRFEGR